MKYLADNPQRVGVFNSRDCVGVFAILQEFTGSAVKITASSR